MAKPTSATVRPEDTETPDPAFAAGPNADEFCSVDWEDIPDKRRWSGAAWLVATVLVICLAVFGGLALRKVLTPAEEPVDYPTPLTANTNTPAGS